MARVFITGSSDGLGLMAARLLIEQGHEVVVHGWNDGRSRDALTAAAGARATVTGDLSTIAGARTVADQVNKLGRFDAVIHNAGVGYRETRRVGIQILEFAASSRLMCDPQSGFADQGGKFPDRPI